MDVLTVSVCAAVRPHNVNVGTWRTKYLLMSG